MEQYEGGEREITWRESFREREWELKREREKREERGGIERERVLERGREREVLSGERGGGSQSKAVGGEVAGKREKGKKKKRKRKEDK